MLSGCIFICQNPDLQSNLLYVRLSIKIKELSISISSSKYLSISVSSKISIHFLSSISPSSSIKKLSKNSKSSKVPPRFACANSNEMLSKILFTYGMVGTSTTCLLIMTVS